MAVLVMLLFLTPLLGFGIRGAGHNPTARWLY